MESAHFNKNIKSSDVSSDEEKDHVKKEAKLVTKEQKIVSPRSSLNNRETELVMRSLVLKIDLLVKRYHKDFNPIAQASLFYLNKKPNGEMLGMN